MASETKSSNINLVESRHAKMKNHGDGFRDQKFTNKIRHSLTDCGPKCEPNCEPIASLHRHPNRRDERPVAIVADEKSGRERAVYPGQSADAVAQRFGFKDYTVEVLA